jgi:hypothetical protein
VWFHPWHEWNSEEETPNMKRHQQVSFHAQHVLQDKEKTPNTKKHQQGCLFMFGMSGRAKGRHRGDATEKGKTTHRGGGHLPIALKER